MSKAKLPHVETDSSGDDDGPKPRLVFRRRMRTPVKLLGGRKVSDVLLWRNRNLSAGILAGATLVWFLFDVAEYNVVTLLCHVALLGMVLLFVWSNAAPLLDRPPPQIPEVIVSEHAFREAARTTHYRLAHFVSVLYDVACGKDLKKFLMVIGSLWILAILGDTCSFTTLLYGGLLCALTLPALYERYEAEVDHLVAKGREDLKKFYRKVDSNVLNKIPRGPVKTKAL
ncbi:seed maturation protein [Zea mays]|uniref:Reticulon-like protein n=1 Tax=Zea mays TaxID=4577 RepID=B6TUJ8_MAIZE|nr:seed maturation protein [Zea mays]ACG40781.1 seed maturation protein [Zea mays]AQK88217.1 Seed maturation protein [Zea mays]|eukprot:NP_001150885.1 seed maturation protein [Zea mays]